jgi:hypothetical protein
MYSRCVPAISIYYRRLHATRGRDMAAFSKQHWARLSPLFRAAHNRLRVARGLTPIPEPAISRYKSPRGPARGAQRPADPADPEAVAAAADFGREVDSNPSDEVFFEWAREHAAECTHEELQQAENDTAHLVRRPRGLLAEYVGVWARAIVANRIPIERNKKYLAVEYASGEIEMTERTVWTALKEVPAAPPLTKKRLRQMFADNIEIAERSGNQRAAELLRWIAATF